VREVLYVMESAERTRLLRVQDLVFKGQTASTPPGIWRLVFGIWYLRFGIWVLASGVSCLVFAIWCSGVNI